MIENNLLKTNFLGKDGFRWWIGQIAPEEAQGDQLNQIGSAWGVRLKVRIYGYHPPDETELANDDLPWAQVLLSTQGGSGKANRARSLRISPGDVVMGFFLDGDDAQLPVILGIFANTNSYYGGDGEYTSPFQPFTGYTSKIKPNPDFIAKNEGGDSFYGSQKSPRFLTKEIIKDLNEQLEKGKAQLEEILDSEELKSGLNNATSELNSFLNSGELQEGINTARSQLDGVLAGAASETGTGIGDKKELIENLKKKLAFPDIIADKDIGREIDFASGIKGVAENFKMTNGVKTELKNLLGATDFKNLVPKDKLKEMANVSKSIVSKTKPMIKDMVNTTFDDLAPALNGGVIKLGKTEFSNVFNSTGNLALAKKAATAAQVGMIPNILDIQNSIPCITKNVTDKLLGDVSNLLGDFVNNVNNFTDCIGDQFIGALFNSVIKGINSELSGVMKGVSNIFDGDIEGMLRGKAEGILGIASVFDGCDIPNADIGSKTNKWVIGLGPASIGLENIAGKVLDIANAAQELKEAAASPGGVLGNLGLFDFMRPDVSTPGFSSTLSDCYTGPPLDCSGIKVNLFGGGGSGAQVNPILGAIVSDTFAVQTASLIGMQVTDAGSGYTSPPFVEIEDTCNKGYGGIARSVIDYDPTSPTYQQVTDVYVVSGGENYPVIDPEEGDNGVYTVDHVVVVRPGENYKPEDIIVDDKGNVYEKFLDGNGKILNVIPPDPKTNNLETFNTIPELTILSSTGRGALISAQLAPRPTYQGQVRQVIDCVSPRNTNIVGFINGEPYYGSFHVHPTTGVKMVGIAHTTAPHAIIYDTPQESRTSRGMMSTSAPLTTVSSPSVQTNVSSTTVQTDTTSTTSVDPIDYSNQQTTQQSNTSSNDNNTGSSGSSGSSGSGGGYSGY